MRLRALHTVHAFRRAYKPGEILPDLDKAEARRLVDIGAAEIVREDEESDGDGVPSPTPPATNTAEAAASGGQGSPAPDEDAGAEITGPELPLEKQPSDMTVEELKAELDTMGVEYPKDSKKADLVAKLQAAWDSE